jgi:23S rRNA pseudouridine1911/1915/1917 synthase
MAAIARTLEWQVPPHWRGKRLDRFLADVLPAAGEDVSRSAAGNLVKSGHVRIDGRTTKAGHSLQGGEQVVVDIPAIEPLSVDPEPIPLDVVFEDEHLLVVNKPPFMPVHPSPGHARGTLVNALVHHCREPLPLPEAWDEDDENDNGDARDDALRPGIVHRLDMDTSGLILVAKTPPALRRLSDQFAARTVQKGYVALVDGLPRRNEGEIDAPIGRHPTRRKEMSVRPEPGKGRAALSRYRVEARFVVDRNRRKERGFAQVEVRPKTGRTHQVRVHMAHLGHPLLADPLYGRQTELSAADVYGRRLASDAPQDPVLVRHALHARTLEFEHPQSGERLALRAPLPADMQAAVDLLRAAADDFARA